MLNANHLILYVLSGILSLIPAIVWMACLFRKSKRRGLQLIIFFGSIFSVVPVFALHYLLEIFPEFDVVSFFQSRIEDQSINFLILFIAVGIVEEIVKQFLIRFLDSKFLLIHTINDSIRYSLIGALGFAFAENAFYFYSIYTQMGIQQLIVPFLFRSIFTTSAHMVFSGFFGYYYGIGKFSINIFQQACWVGKKHRFATFVGRILGFSRMQAYKELKILYGLLLAIILHALFNLLLQFNQILPVIMYITASFIYLQYILSKKSGELILVTDISDERSSTMASKDENVVIELMGMWFNENKYVDVVHICQRLLARDPDNKVVQLFKAKALEKIGDTDRVQNKILQTIFPKEKQKSLTQLIEEKKANKETDKCPIYLVVDKEKEMEKKNNEVYKVNF